MVISASEILEKKGYDPTKWVSGGYMLRLFEELIVQSGGRIHRDEGDSNFTFFSDKGVVRLIVIYNEERPVHWRLSWGPMDSFECHHYDVRGDGKCGARAFVLAKRLLLGETITLGDHPTDHHGWVIHPEEQLQLVRNEAETYGGEVTWVWGIVHNDEALARQLQEAEEGGGGPPPVQAVVGASVPTPVQVATYGATDNAAEAIELVSAAEHREAEALTEAYFRQLAHDREQKALQMELDAAIAAALAGQ